CLQVPDSLRPVFRLLGQTSRNCFFPLRWNRRSVLYPEVSTALRNRRRDLVMNLSPIDDANKGRFTAQELVQSRADRINVVQGSRRIAIPLLRTYVRRAA